MVPGDNFLSLRRYFAEDLVEVAIRISLIGFLVFVCIRIFAPFAPLMLWGLILAVALYPLCRKLASRLGCREAFAATIIVILALLLIGGPTIVLGSLFAGQIHAAYDAFLTQSITIPVPDPAIAEWPLIGDRLYPAWQAAAADLPGYVESLQPQLGNFARTALAVAAATMGEVMLLLAAIVVAGIMMAYGKPGSAAALRILSRLVGPERSERVHRLVTSTIRSVAVGVVGVAFIQALLLGIGFVFAEVPAPGVIAVIVLVLCIVQLPAALISLPVIGYIWWAGDLSTFASVFWSVYLLLAGLADNVLKPMLLGRGVEAPMVVILIGALSGMASAGVMGLFLGAVLLALGYVLFRDWIYREADPSAEPSTPGAHTSP